MTGEINELVWSWISLNTILLIIVWVIVLYVIVRYNTLIKLRNNIKNAFADIDVQIKLRFNLVENLVNTVKGYAKHEKETLENLIKARTNFMNAESRTDKVKADNMLTWALKSLFAVAENYPDLKANQNFLQLQTELSDIENKIASARRYYNSSTNEYNTTIQGFPTNIIAKIFWFKDEVFFAANENEKVVPKVNF